MQFNNPLSSEKADRIIHALGVCDGARVIEAGCGRGEFLIRVIEASRACGLGIDVDATAIAAARDSAARRIPDARVEFRASDMRDEALRDGRFDLAICLGATHAFGAGDSAYPNAIERLSRCVCPGGRLLLGEGYWKQAPAAEYLGLIGEPVGIYRDHAANISFAERRGLVPLYALVSNDDEWDHFEWSHRMKIERESALRPEDRETAQRLARSRAWRDGYLRWGRATMGFGFYLFMKPSATRTSTKFG